MTVSVRKFSASPVRNATEVWNFIVDTISSSDVIKTELRKVAGVAASIIADGIPSIFPITIIGSGPRLRLYCLYDEDALGDDKKEDPLNWKLFDQQWQVFFPVEKADQEWTDKILKGKGNNFFTYVIGEEINTADEQEASQPSQLTINIEKLKTNG